MQRGTSNPNFGSGSRRGSRRLNRSIARRGRAALVLLSVQSAAASFAQERRPGFADPLLGRWDLTIETDAEPYPSWLEVRLRTELELAGRFVGRVGSVRHVSAIDYADGRLEIVVPVQYEPNRRDLRFEGRLVGDRLEGTTAADDGANVRWTGVRAPALVDRGGRERGAPIEIFNGRDLGGWIPRADSHAGCWSVESGVLVATPPCVDLVTERVFGDFVLHAELQYPPGSNSGVYLRGRYEVQIADNFGMTLDPLRMGAIYGFLAPSVDAARAADEWQTLDVTLHGRRVTVVLNGTTIIDGQEIPGITGGALDSDEGSPGPIMLQGDHGAIRFRNLMLTPYR
jgi:hypothetical protein